MPTAVISLEASTLPASLQLAPCYDHVFVLVTWHGRPLGHGTLPLRDGVVDGEMLLQAVERIAGRAIGARQLDEWLGWEPAAAAPSISATVAICTRDRLDDLARCLRALDAMPDDGQEILVIDSASRDGEAVRGVVEQHPRARYVREDRPGL
ncbi:MAG: glycosyltransferase, partial [Gemmatimonadaceae bacterium]